MATSMTVLPSFLGTRLVSLVLFFCSVGLVSMNSFMDGRLVLMGLNVVAFLTAYAF